MKLIFDFQTRANFLRRFFFGEKMTAVSMMTLPSHMTGFLHELGPSSGVYSYVSYPSTILPHTPRAKYRNELQGMVVLKQ